MENAPKVDSPGSSVAEQGTPTEKPFRFNDELRGIAKDTARKYLKRELLSDIDDVLSEVAIRFLRDQHGTVEDLRSWTVVVTRNVCFDFNKSRAARERCGPHVEDQAAAAQDRLTASPDQETFLLYREALVQLRPKLNDKEFAIVSGVIQQEKLAEIQKRLELSEGKFRHLFFKTLRHIMRLAPRLLLPMLIALGGARRGDASSALMRRRMAMILGAVIVCGNPADSSLQITRQASAANTSRVHAHGSADSAEDGSVVQSRMTYALTRRLAELTPVSASPPPSRQSQTASNVPMSRVPPHEPMTSGTIDDQWRNLMASPVSYLGNGRMSDLELTQAGSNHLRWTDLGNGRFSLEGDRFPVDSRIRADVAETLRVLACGIPVESLSTSFLCMGARVEDAVFMECENQFYAGGCAIESDVLPARTLNVGRLANGTWLLGNAWDISLVVSYGAEAHEQSNARFMAPWALRTASFPCSCTPFNPKDAFTRSTSYVPMDTLGVIEQVCEHHATLPACRFGPFRVLRFNFADSTWEKIHLELLSSTPWEGTIGIYQGTRLVRECTSEICEFEPEQGSVISFRVMPDNARGLTLIAPYVSTHEFLGNRANSEDRRYPFLPVTFGEWWCNDDPGEDPSEIFHNGASFEEFADYVGSD